MARKKHHTSHRKQSARDRFHEHAGEERHLHGYHLSPHARHEERMYGLHHKYDTLRHERDMHNDEMRHDSHKERSGSYHYDREDHRLSGKYEGYKGRRHQEMMDAGMIHEDHREIANLPQHVMIKPYPHSNGYTPEDLDDTIRGIDHQMNYDNDQKMRHFFPKKV